MTLHYTTLPRYTRYTYGAERKFSTLRISGMCETRVDASEIVLPTGKSRATMGRQASRHLLRAIASAIG